MREAKGSVRSEALDDLQRRAIALFHAIQSTIGGAGSAAALGKEVRAAIEAGLADKVVAKDLPTWGVFASWVAVRSLGKIQDEVNYPLLSRSWIDEWMLGKIIADTLQKFEVGDAAWKWVELIKLLTTHQAWNRATLPVTESQLAETLFRDEDGRTFLHVHRHQGILWFNKELFETMLAWLGAIGKPSAPATAAILTNLRVAGIASGYQVEALLEAVKPEEDD